MPTLRDLGDRVEIKAGDRLIAAYVYGAAWSKPFLYPVNAPDGRCVTSQGPGDHPHHRSLWVAHGDVNGVDCWSEQESHGRIVHQSFLGLGESEESAVLTARNLWARGDGKALLEELRGVRVPSPSPDAVTIDLSVTFAARYGRVIFGDTKEAGLASVRVAGSMEVEEGGRLENSSGGVGEAQVWGKRALWCDYSGDVQGERLGIAVFDHPMNPRHPTYWHARDYGLMTANCFGISLFEKNPSLSGRLVLDDGQDLTFYYRIYVHGGDAERGMVAEEYERFASSPHWRVKT